MPSISLATTNFNPIASSITASAFNTLPVVSVRQTEATKQEIIDQLPCSGIIQKIKKDLENVPKDVDADNPSLKSVLKDGEELSQCLLSRAKLTTDQRVKAELLKEALFNNNDSGKINDREIRNLINSIDKSRLTEDAALDLALASKINTEARYHSRIARGNHAQAKKLWDSGTSGVVTVDGVDTAYHFVKATSNKGERHPLIIIAPGRGEPMANYIEMVSEFNAENRDVIVVGFSGNGDVGHPGHLESFSDTTKGLAAIIAQRSDITSVQHTSVSLVAHSTGATTAVRYCEEYSKDPAVKQMVLIAPLFKINASYVSLFAAKVIDTVLDKTESVVNTIISPFTSYRANLDAIHISDRESYYDGNYYTQSSARYKQLVKVRDEHQAMPPTFSWVNEAQQACSLALADADGLKDENLDILVFMAGKDSVVDNDKTREFIAKSNAKSITVDGALHTLVQEADPYRGPMMQEILKFTR
ncbi:alpha/beta fold hydrolase [Grimontia hollisae]|uniref:Lysophospholipase L2 n=1 Tax=Grimontia hollisae TaxID=673 RepID=A0A377J6S4_GRIHO|nr:alpha/beta hydrolase [Grimontia hollisae]MDF2185039.1 alpha/beta hydrolase [Grimontia hollisae]STO98187.1 lysophospholipase L2 [Grimontia hollisae]